MIHAHLCQQAVNFQDQNICVTLLPITSNGDEQCFPSFWHIHYMCQWTFNIFLSEIPSWWIDFCVTNQYFEDFTVAIGKYLGASNLKQILCIWTSSLKQTPEIITSILWTLCWNWDGPGIQPDNNACPLNHDQWLLYYKSPCYSMVQWISWSDSLTLTTCGEDEYCAYHDMSVMIVNLNIVLCSTVLTGKVKKIRTLTLLTDVNFVQ